MNLRHSDWEFNFTLDENRVSQLIIESPKLMANMINELRTQIKGEEGKFVLVDNDREEKISSKVELIVDPFALDINNRKVLTKLYSELGNIALDEENYLATQEVLGGVLTLIDHITNESEYNIIYSMDTDIIRLLKEYDVKLDITTENLSEQILNYTKVMQNYCGVKLFVFVNLKSYLEKEEIECIYKELGYNKTSVIAIEPATKFLLSCENTWIIDNDLCEIHIS